MAEYQRRTAEAAEATRRNTRLLVLFLVVLPLVVGGVVLVAFIVGSVGSDVSARSEARGIARVEQVYEEVGYTPPSYTDVSSQASGICENLGNGLSHDQAAEEMAQGFGEGLTVSMAQQIVAAVDENIC